MPDGEQLATVYVLVDVVVLLYSAVEVVVKTIVMKLKLRALRSPPGVPQFL